MMAGRVDGRNDGRHKKVLLNCRRNANVDRRMSTSVIANDNTQRRNCCRKFTTSSTLILFSGNLFIRN